MLQSHTSTSVQKVFNFTLIHACLGGHTKHHNKVGIDTIRKELKVLKRGAKQANKTADGMLQKYMTY